MSLTRTASSVQRAQITVDFVDGAPAHLVHEGVLYRVTDMPTRLEDDMGGMTHPLPITGWRFQGTDGITGRSRMFDICRQGTYWRLIRTYD